MMTTDPRPLEPRDVVCPVCLAMSGDYCRSIRSGYLMPDPHLPRRVRASDRADLYYGAGEDAGVTG